MRYKMTRCAVWLVVGLLARFAWAEPRSAGKWLVDLGRDYPLTPQAGVSTADAELSLLLMQAASRVEPALAESYRWQVDLLRVLGREDEAQAALETYLQQVPDDIVARLAWVQTRLEGMQTADARAGFCREQLAQADQDPAVTSELHRQLAYYHWNRGEEQKARREAEAAVAEDAHNIAARELLLGLVEPSERLIHRIGLLLARLEMSPADIDAARGLGDEFNLRGLSSDAELWYAHAQHLAELLSPDTTPTDLLLGRAAMLMELNQLDEAETLAKQAVMAEPMVIDTLIVRAQVALLKKDMDAAAGHFRQVEKLCKTRIQDAAKAHENMDSDTLGRIAWVLAHYASALDAAERLANAVLEYVTGDVVAHRTLGSIHMQRQEYAAAERVLTPIAGRDVWGAILLAEALKGAKPQEQAVARLRAVATPPANFEQRYQIKTLCSQWEVDFPALSPEVQAAHALAAEFKPEIRDYPFHPENYLKASVAMENDDMPPGQPWWCKVRFRNAGSFPITIGRGMMVEPAMLAVIETRGDRPRSSEGAIRIMLDRRLQLGPLEDLEVRQTLDLGPIRSGMSGTPQQGQDVQVTAILNPWSGVDGQGRPIWFTGIGGIRLQTMQFRRVPQHVEVDVMRQVFAGLSSAAVAERITALDQLAMLLAEHQHLAAGRLRYAARPIDANAVQAAVLAMANDGEWYVRARLAEAMRGFALDDATMPTAMKLLNDSHWLVRSLARRLLADQHGNKFQKVLESTAQSDPDDWARRFAEILLERQRQAEAAARQTQTQPAQEAASPS